MSISVRQPADPWQRTTTAHGFAADEVISALQKSIRRAKTDNALLLGWEMYLTSPELEEKLWSRLCVIAVEDIGMGRADAPMLMEALYRQHQRYDRPTGDRFLFAAHAIRVICSADKDRTSDDMVNWAMRGTQLGELRPEIPDVARDMHTFSGQQAGRNYRFFMEEASKVIPEIPDKDQRYRDWILAALDAGKLS